jgi:hypothetical protein
VSERRDRFDPELAELFSDDPELLELAQLVRESRPEPALDPRFSAVLRARLMDEASTALAPRRRFRFRPAPVSLAAWGTFAVGAGLAAVAVVTILGTRTPAPGGLALVAANVSHQRTVDTHQAITLSFNEPMDEQNRQSVLAALEIQPATQVTVTWKSPETLVITPIHPLAADTDYQVTIPRSAVHSQSGQTLTTNVTIDFGTQPTATPSPTASPVPTLEPAAVGQAASDGLPFWGPGDAPGVTDSTAGQPSSAASSSATASPSAAATGVSPSPTAAAVTSSAASTPSPAAAGAVIFPQGQSPVSLSDTPAAMVAVSPDGLYVSLAITLPDGSGEIVVENADGSHANRVWPTRLSGGAPVTTLAWDGSDRIVFVTSQGIDAVDLDDQWSQLYPFPSGGSASGVVLAADGLHAFVPTADVQPGATASPSAAASASPSSEPASPTATPTSTYVPSAGDGWLITLTTAGGQSSTPTQLAGSASGVVAFSGTGDEVAWVDTSGGTSAVLEAPVSDPTTITPVPGAPTEGIEELALDAHGATLAYGLGSGGIEAKTASGSVLGTAPDEVTSLVFSPDGTHLAFVAAGSLDVAQVQTALATPAPSLCQGADQVLSQFVDDQVAHDRAGLADLSAPDAPPAASMTPPSVDRGYVVSSGCTAGVTNSGPTLIASARLIVDPTGSSPGQVKVTDETVTLSQSDGKWWVTGLSVPPLRTQGSGPDVLSVAVTPPAAGSTTPKSVVTVTFDSDLDPASVVATSLWLETADGQALSLLSTPAYDPDTRTATLTVAGTLPTGTRVVVGTAISDIDGGHPSAQSLYPVGG